MKTGRRSAVTGKEFIKALANGKSDAIAVLLDLLERTKVPYCVVGGLAVNAYADPVVSLDVDIVVAVQGLPEIRRAATEHGLRIEDFEHSVNLHVAGSDLRIQLQTDARYQAFLSRAESRDVLGYRMLVAASPDVLQGKVWAWSDGTRRPSKRQKDLADIMRLVETDPGLATGLPEEVRKIILEG